MTIMTYQDKKKILTGIFFFNHNSSSEVLAYSIHTLCDNIFGILDGALLP